MRSELFASLHVKLIARVRQRIRSGEMTERGFAKIIGLSQPHLHNVLKGLRSLSTESADLILKHLGISISDLLEPGTSPLKTGSRAGNFAIQAPLLGGAAGPFRKLDAESLPTEFYPIPQFASLSVEDPVWAILGYDPEIYPYFQEDDLALIGRIPESLALPEHDSVYLVKTHNGMLVRALRLAGNRLHLITPKTASEPRLWTALPLDGRKPGEVIFGKLILIQRKLRPEGFSAARFTP